MTNETAKECLTFLAGTGFSEIGRKPIDMAIEALDKQIPKAVEADEWPSRDRELKTHYWCPSCECEVDIDRDNWCFACGQHLLWEEE